MYWAIYSVMQYMVFLRVDGSAVILYMVSLRVGGSAVRIYEQQSRLDQPPMLLLWCSTEMFWNLSVGFLFVVSPQCICSFLPKFASPLLHADRFPRRSLDTNPTLFYLL
jgi:hypothetical protein